MSKYKHVYISSGHSKYLPGAVGNGYKEHELAAKVVDKIYKKLLDKGVEVYKYHDNNATSVSTNLNNIIGKHLSHSDGIDISVHLNSGGGTGSEVLFRGDQKGRAIKYSSVISKSLHLKDRGPKLRTDLAFLNSLSLRGRDPLLFELCFIDSKSDVNNLLKYIDDLVDGIVKTILDEVDYNKGVSTKAVKKSSTSNSKVYTVKNGDSLWSIAQAKNTTVSNLRERNGLKGDLIHIGDKLKY